MARFRLKLGDVFCVQLENGRRRFFQYVSDDLTQLNSEVIRIFSKEYLAHEDIDLDDIVSGEVDFVAHTVTNVGVKLGLWEKIGNSQRIEKPDVYFKTSEDDGNPEVKVSKKWWVWRVNEDMQYVGELTGEYIVSEVGSVLPAPAIVERIKTGKYQFVYPEH